MASNLEEKETQSSSMVVIKSEPLDLEVDIKVEPPDIGSEFESCPVVNEVDIKVEPTDTGSDFDESCPVENVNTSVKVEVEPCPEAEDITVKIEPTVYSSDDELNLASYLAVKYQQSEKNLAPKTEVKKRKSKDPDKDYKPPKKKKKVKNEVVRRTFTNKAKKKENSYSDNVTKNIELVTITEEERLIEFRDLWQTRKHMRYFCEHCAIGFVMEEPYLVHMKSHAPEAGDIMCDICRCRGNNKEQMYKHKLRHYRRYRCSICERVFKDKETASSHVMSEHVHEAFICGECGKGFRRPAYLKKHVAQQHTQGEELQCPICARVLPHRSMYNTHVRRHNEEVRNPVGQLFICDLCSKHMKTKQALRRHLEVHAKKRNLACSLCPSMFNTKKGLTLHELNKHSGDKERRMLQQCPQCERECTTPALLRQHIRRMHTDRTKKYQCDHCKRFYWSKGELRAHITWSHAPTRGERALFCCGREFRTRTRLKDHVAIHHLGHERERIYKCDQCDKAFANKQVLNRHKKSHTDFTYPCPDCGVRFKCEGYVKVHYQIKHLNMTRAQIREMKQARKTHYIPPIRIPNFQHTTMAPNESQDVRQPQDVINSEVKEINFEKVLVKQEVDSESEISAPLFDLAELSNNV